MAVMLSALLVIAFSAFTFASEAPSAVHVLNPENFDVLVGASLPAFIEFYAPWCGHCKKLAPDWDKLGAAFKKESVVVGKVDCDEHKDLCSKYDVSGFPTLKWFDAGSKSPIKYEEGRDLEDLMSFLNGKLGTNIQPAIIASNVVALTPATFDSYVLDTERNALVEFYAPWCGHCKSLAPIYEELANAYKADKNVVIAKVDADKHRDLGEKYGVSGFPTIKWFPATSKIAQDYEGGRSLEDFVKFINKEVGLARSPSGDLNEQAGRIESIDVISSEYTTAADKDAVLKKTEEAASAVTGDKAGYAAKYLKAVKNIREKGADYISKETARLERMLSGSLKAEKRDDITIRRNILQAFLPLPPPEPETAPEEEEPIDEE